MGRQASVLIADEILFSLTGKAYLNGVYMADIAIPSDPTTVSQLVFLFLVEADITDPFRTLTFEVTLPGANPIRQQPMPVLPPVSQLPGRTLAYYRLPFLIPGPVLRPGKIEAKVIHENGELSAGAPWITLVPPSPTTH